MKIQIKARFTDAVLFECDVDTADEYPTRTALEKAVAAGAYLAGAYLDGANLAGANLDGANLARAYLDGANLDGAYLAGAYLDGANLAGANLDGANLAGAYLDGANLAGANLDGANLARAYLDGANLDIKPATREEAIANLDKVREIILDKPERLEMGHWHGDEQWKERTCAEETLCGTTHCLAGWLQVCSTDPKIRELHDPQLAGVLAAPIASHMFFRGQDEAKEWLQKRTYAEPRKVAA